MWTGCWWQRISNWLVIRGGWQEIPIEINTSFISPSIDIVVSRLEDRMHGKANSITCPRGKAPLWMTLKILLFSLMVGPHKTIFRLNEMETLILRTYNHQMRGQERDQPKAPKESAWVEMRAGWDDSWTEVKPRPPGYVEIWAKNQVCSFSLAGILLQHGSSQLRLMWHHPASSSKPIIHIKWENLFAVLSKNLHVNLVTDFTMILSHDFIAQKISHYHYIPWEQGHTWGN